MLEKINLQVTLSMSRLHIRHQTASFHQETDRVSMFGFEPRPIHIRYPRSDHGDVVIVAIHTLFFGLDKFDVCFESNAHITAIDLAMHFVKLFYIHMTSSRHLSLACVSWWVDS